VLQAADREVGLRRKSFELLRYLGGNPDRLVTKEELFKAICPNVIVANESLTQCVSEVRQAIGDSKPTITATVPGRGYRFVATVSRVATSAAGLGTPGVPPVLMLAGETPAVRGGAAAPPASPDAPRQSQSSDPEGLAEVS